MNQVLLLTAMVGFAGRSVAAQATPCCGIVGIDLATGIVTAKVTATGYHFEFRVTNQRTLASLKVGQGVYANFAGKQASIDGRTSCCAITSGPTAPATAPAVRPPVPPPTPRAADPAPAVTTAISPSILNSLPAVTVGAPIPRTALRGRATSRFQTASVTAQVGGRNVTAPVLSLRGLKAVEQAPDLPEGARRVLEMLVRRVPPGESDHYMVNTQLAKEWMASHKPVPESVKPTEPKEKKCGNWYDSWDCAGQAVNDEWQRTYDHAVDEWKDAEKTLAEAWETSVGCFTERTISTGDFPVKFAITRSMTVNLSQSGSKGSAQGTVSGTATLGIPMQSDVTARLDLFYIPCLPFAIRPKSLSGTGVLTVGQELQTTVSATGSFNKTFTIPPSGGPVIPIQVFPIVIAGVPVAEMDVSAYIEGEIEVSSAGKAEGQFRIKNSNPTALTFSCSGKGCSASSKGQPSATTTNESAQIQGTVTVKPAIYTALQLDFNYEALSARVGPQPYLLGEASGCAAAAATQTVGGAANSQENHVLSADLDWGVELRAEALVLGKIVGNSYRTRLMNDKHLWFRDLAPGGSNALVAVAESTGPQAAAKPAGFRIRMPSCYPYPDPVEYRLTWTGNATPQPRPGCQWQPGAGTCRFDPAKDLVIGLTWPAPGAYSLTVVAVGDDHKRTFAPAPAPAPVSVNVVP